MALVINGRFLQRPTTGVERYGRMLIRVIAKEWPDSRIVIPDGPMTSQEDLGLEVVRTHGKGGHAWEQLILPRALEKGDLLFSPANTGPLRVRHQALVLHDLAVVHHPEWFDRRFARWYGFLLPRLSRRVTKVLTVSPYSAADIEQTYGLPTGRVAVVGPYTSPLVKQNLAMQDRPYYLLVASRDPRKGLDLALEWYKGLSAPSFDLIIVGRKAKQFALVETPVLAGVHYVEEAEDAQLDGLYRGAKALLFPSRAEGFGLPILEALTRGTPVIANDIPVLRELFSDAVHLVDFNTPMDVDAACSDLDEPATRSKWSQLGLTRAEQFSEQSTTMALSEALTPLLLS